MRPQSLPRVKTERKKMGISPYLGWVTRHNFRGIKSLMCLWIKARNANVRFWCSTRLDHHHNCWDRKLKNIFGLPNITYKNTSIKDQSLLREIYHYYSHLKEKLELCSCSFFFWLSNQDPNLVRKKMVIKLAFKSWAKFKPQYKKSFSFLKEVIHILRNKLQAYWTFGLPSLQHGNVDIIDYWPRIDLFHPAHFELIYVFG